MSESVARAHAKGGRGLSAVLPGLGQLLAGRWGVGTMALTVWLGFVWVVVARRHVVLEAIGGAWGELQLLLRQLGLPTQCAPDPKETETRW